MTYSYAVTGGNHVYQFTAGTGSITWSSVNPLNITSSNGLNLVGLTGPTGSTNTLTYNSSSGLVSYSNNFTTQTSYGTATGTVLTVDALQFQLSQTTVYPQIRGLTAGTMTVNWSGTASVAAGTGVTFGNGGTTISSSAWVNLFATNMSSGGDSATIIINDATNTKTYRGTFIRGTASGVGSGSIIVERLL